MKYERNTCALQGTSWSGKGTVIKKNYMILYSGHESDTYEFGTEFLY
jgi:hypothetical protein